MKNVPRRVHYSALGEAVNMAELVAKHGDTVAIGDVRMNARGDLLDVNNQVVVARKQIEQEYYTNNPKGVKQKQVSLKAIQEDQLYTPQQALEQYYEQTRQSLSAEQDMEPPAEVMSKKGRRLVDDEGV